jgi:hypothetical protein
MTKAIEEAVADNPRTVQQTGGVATKGNFEQRDLSNLQLSPGTLTSQRRRR